MSGSETMRLEGAELFPLPQKLAEKGMILDVLENALNYSALNKGFEKAAGFLSRPDLRELPVGRYEIEGDSIYALVSKGPGRRQADALLETHERYIDIQLVLAGKDAMGWRPKSLCERPTGECDQRADVRFFADEPVTWLLVESGMVAIFFPEDAHMPMISSGQLHKVVVKVAVASR